MGISGSSMKFEIWPDGAIERLGAVAKELHRLGVTETDAVRVLAVVAASEDIEEVDRQGATSHHTDVRNRVECLTDHRGER